MYAFFFFSVSQSDYDANTLLSLQLEETETDILLDMKSSRVMADTPYAEQIQARNDRYGEYTAHMARSGDGYVKKTTQTLSGTGSAGAGKLTKGVQARPVATEDASVQASGWDISDAKYALEKAVSSQATEGLELLRRSAKDEEEDDLNGEEDAESEKDTWDSDSGEEDKQGGRHSKSKKKDTIDEYAVTALQRQVSDVLNAGNSAPGFLVDAEGSVNIAPADEPLEDKPNVRRKLSTDQSARTSQRRNERTSVTVSQSLRKYGNSQNQMSSSSGDFRRGIESSNQLETSTQDSSSTHSNDQEEDEGVTDETSDSMHDRISREKEFQKLADSKQLMSGLSVVERAIQQNLYHHAHRLYRSRAGLEAVEGLLAGMKSIIVAAVRVENSKFGTEAQAAGSNDLYLLASKVRELKAEEARAQNQQAVLHGEKGKGEHTESEGGTLEDQYSGSADDEKQIMEGSDNTDESATSDEEEVDGKLDAEDGGNASEQDVLNIGEDAGSELASTLAVLADRAKELGHQSVSALLEGLQSLALGPKAPPSLLLLFSYSCPDVKNMAVNAMAWNQINSDLLAAGYGPATYIPPSKSRGYLALWSIKNPEYPQALIKVESGVTSLDFSKVYPSLLAVGLYDGRVAIYDVRRLLANESNVTAEAISEPLAHGAHTEAVWEIKWVDTSQANKNIGEDENTEEGHTSRTTNTATTSAPSSERLVSISSDGKVNEWNTKKGLQCKTLIHLKQPRTEDGDYSETQKSVLASTTSDNLASALQSKRYGNLSVPKPVPNHSANISGLTVEDAMRSVAKEKGKGGADRPPAGSKQSSNVHESRISRTVSGLCFDFPLSDPAVYLAGTEDGYMHQCSVSYTEQTLHNYKVHGGPVNKLRISPFYEPAVVTAGGDWCVRLWDLNESSQDEDGVQTKEEECEDDPEKRHESKKYISDMETPVSMFASPESADAVTDLQWHPQVSTWLGSVSGDGHICLWEVGTGAPLVDYLAREPEEGQEHNQGIIGLIKSAGEERTDKNNTDESDEESDYGGKEKNDGSKNKQKSGKRRGSHASDSSSTDSGGDSGEGDCYAEKGVRPCKRLTSFMFAKDAPVVVTGDSSGRIDVYRLMGSVSQAKFTGYTQAQLTEELYYAMHPDRKREDEEQAE